MKTAKSGHTKLLTLKPVWFYSKRSKLTKTEQNEDLHIGYS